MNINYKKSKNLFIRIFCVLFSFITLISVWQSVFVSAAINSSLKLDSTNVLEDLRSDTSFNINNYPFNEAADLELISFNEYCYSFYSNLQENYGLYIYIYNPKCLDIVQNSIFNKIEMAVSYDKNGKPVDYEKLQLKFCSVSTESDYYHLFYKFKVVDKDNKILDAVKSNERRYDVSGIELYTEGQLNAVDFNISRTFYYTGYAAGYGPNNAADTTLACRTEKLETIDLNVHHTYWRSKTSSKGAGYQNQLDTVYFTVPNRFFEEYGKLQRIKAEWYEYKTKDIVVTSNQDFYNAAKGYIGRATDNDLSWAAYENLNTQGGEWNMTWSYNWNSPYSMENLDILYYLFPTKNWCDIKQYDPYSTTETIGGVLSNDLYEYIFNYNKTYDNGTVKDGRISADLFESDIDDYRKIDNEYGKIQYGYSYYDFDADVDLFDLLAYDPYDHGYFENFLMYNFWNALFRDYGTIEESFTDQSSIIVLDKNEYLSGNNQDISDRFFVNYNDVDNIKSVYNQAKTNKEKVVLFRFAVSDYYARDLVLNPNTNSWIQSTTSLKNGQAYRAKESVFLDFDIIQLTFNKEGVYTVIPVVASPIDIVDDITPPYNPEGRPWWWYLIYIALWAILIIVIIKFFPYIIKYLFKGLYYVLASPVYIIRWFVKKGQ